MSGPRASLRRAAIAIALLGAGCFTAPPPQTAPRPWRTPSVVDPPADPATWGELAHEVDDLAFPGGQVHFEMRWADGRVIQTARNDFLVPVTIAWSVGALDNLEADSDLAGITVLPAALEIGANGPTEVLATFSIADPSQPFYRYLDFHAQFGDPEATPGRYVYSIPFVVGDRHRIIQGMGGSFSHTGSNQYAVDWECPEGTPVVAMRDGVVVALHEGATGNGTTSEWTSYALTNFVLVAHDDGTIGQYMHLEPDGVDVEAGHRVSRGERLGRSGNTGYSTTPHLHFQVMTAAADGLGAISFPFELLVAPKIAEPPVEGQLYRAWEQD